jgi:hypothetical protein
MKSIHLVIVIVFSVIFSFSQNSQSIPDKKMKNRFVIWLIPSAAKNIYGIAIGPVGSEAICNRPYTKYSHGLNLQVPGQGFFQVFFINKVDKGFFAGNDAGRMVYQDTIPERAVHNGLLISPLGTFTDQVNGMSISLWMSMGKKVNGLSFNLLWNLYSNINGVSLGLVNHAGAIKGLQIGLINKAKEMKGFQFGLWNINEKRSLPLINWNFRGKTVVRDKQGLRVCVSDNSSGT